MRDYAEETAAVSQASRMISVQAQCSVADTLLIFKQRAHDWHEPLEDVAIGVVDRRIRFGIYTR